MSGTVSIVTPGLRATVDQEDRLDTSRIDERVDFGQLAGLDVDLDDRSGRTNASGS
jgi:hypothetical protein